MPALRGLQQRDCSGVAPDSLLSLEDSEILLEERSTLSTKPPQRYNNFRIYQSADLWLLELTHYNIEWASSFRSPVRKSQIPRWMFFIFQGSVGKFFGLIISFFRSFSWFFRRNFHSFGGEFLFLSELLGNSSVKNFWHQTARHRKSKPSSHARLSKRSYIVYLDKNHRGIFCQFVFYL